MIRAENCNPLLLADATSYPHQSLPKQAHSYCEAASQRKHPPTQKIHQNNNTVINP
jgi:hypothetical protein